MAISKMKKLELVSPAECADELVRELMWAGCVEIHDISGDFESDPDFSACDAGKEADKVKEEYESIERALAVLKRYDRRKTGLFSARAHLKKEDCTPGSALVAEALGYARRILELKTESDSLKAAGAAASDTLSLLAPWESYPEPLCEKVTENLRVMLGSVSAAVCDERIYAALVLTPDGREENKGVFFEAVKEASDKQGRRYIAVFFLKQLKAQVTAALLGEGFIEADFSRIPGATHSTAADLISKTKEQKKKIEDQEAAKEAELKELCGQTEKLKLAYDILLTEGQELDARAKSVSGGHVRIMSGWVPESSAGRLADILGQFGCAYEMNDPEEEDDVPVLLYNNRFSQPFESVIEMYSLPSYRGFDPTAIMSVFYFVIFGFMLADVFYGLIVFLSCMFALKKFELRGTAKKLVSMFGICGVSCTAAGVILSGYFGNLPSQIVSVATGGDFSMPGIDVLSTNGIIIFIVIALGLGALEILTGLAINIYMLCKRGEYFSAVFDVGSWYVIFAGIALFATVGGYVSIAVLALGLLMKVCTAGRNKKGIFGKVFGGLLGLYDIIGYASDAVSYVRIMALGLSSTVIALVVNIMATLLITPGFSAKSLVGWLLMPLILIFGHLLNLALNLLGCFVHDGRLQYIEFFGKFYEDGGRPFEALAPVTKYTVALPEGKADK